MHPELASTGEKVRCSFYFIYWCSWGVFSENSLLRRALWGVTWGAICCEMWGHILRSPNFKGSLINGHLLRREPHEELSLKVSPMKGHHLWGSLIRGCVLWVHLLKGSLTKGPNLRNSLEGESHEGPSPQGKFHLEAIALLKFSYEEHLLGRILIIGYLREMCIRRHLLKENFHEGAISWGCSHT